MSSTLIYFNSVFNMFWITHDFATSGGSSAFPSQLLWIVTVIYMQSYTVYMAMLIVPYTRNSWRVKGSILFILRCMQSAGSSTTIALSSGVVADVATSAQRGSYMGFVTAGSLMGPSLGPVIGGLLAQYLGWRAIFWFLVILSAAFLVPFLIFFPETARRVVGNGSIPPQKWNMSLISYLKARKAATEGSPVDAPHGSRKISFPNPLKTLSIVFQKDTSMLLLSNAVMFAGFYDISASIPSIFPRLYGLNDLQIGLCYLPFGVGSTVASIINGKFLDYNYRRIAKRLGFPLVKNRHTDLRNFPIEKARLEIAFPLILISSSAVIAFGWCLQLRHAHRRSHDYPVYPRSLPDRVFQHRQHAACRHLPEHCGRGYGVEQLCPVPARGRGDGGACTDAGCHGDRLVLHLHRVRYDALHDSAAAGRYSIRAQMAGRAAGQTGGERG